MCMNHILILEKSQVLKQVSSSMVMEVDVCTMKSILALLLIINTQFILMLQTMDGLMKIVFTVDASLGHQVRIRLDLGMFG